MQDLGTLVHYLLQRHYHHDNTQFLSLIGRFDFLYLYNLLTPRPSLHLHLGPISRGPLWKSH